jgi:hypothetical protein
MKIYFISKIWMNVGIYNFIVTFCVVSVALAQTWKKIPKKP